MVAGLRDSALVHTVLLIKFDPDVRDRDFAVASTAEESACLYACTRTAGQDILGEKERKISTGLMRHYRLA